MTDALSEIAAEFDVLSWAADVERKLPQIQSLDDLRLFWNAGKARLFAADPARFRDLNAKLAQRAKELNGGMQ